MTGCIDAFVEGWEQAAVTVGMSTATTARLRRAGEADRFLKTQPTTWDRGLDAEAARLEWLATTPLADRVAKVIAFEPGDRLLTSAVPGRDAVFRAENRSNPAFWARKLGIGPRKLAQKREGLAERMGAALRAVHDALDPATCPFDARLDRRLAAVGERVRLGMVDTADFETEYQSMTPDQVFDRLVRERPDHEDVVVTHGDWCFPNVLFDDDGAWTGMVDVAGLGLACRWYDLGIGVRSVWHNVDAEAADAFFAGYGIEADEALVRYYILMDELQ